MLGMKRPVISDRMQVQIGQVTCPNCRVIMPRISLEADHGDGLHEAVYRCPLCKTEMMRWIKL